MTKEIVITKEDFIRWKKGKVTRYLLDELEKRIRQIEQEATDGEIDEYPPEFCQAKLAKLTGRKKAFCEIIAFINQKVEDELCQD